MSPPPAMRIAYHWNQKAAKNPHSRSISAALTGPYTAVYNRAVVVVQFPQLLRLLEAYKSVAQRIRGHRLSLEENCYLPSPLSPTSAVH